MALFIRDTCMSSADNTASQLSLLLAHTNPTGVHPTDDSIPAAATPAPLETHLITPDQKPLLRTRASPHSGVMRVQTPDTEAKSGGIGGDEATSSGNTGSGSGGKGVVLFDKLKLQAHVDVLRAAGIGLTVYHVYPLYTLYPLYSLYSLKLSILSILLKLSYTPLHSLTLPNTP